MCTKYKAILGLLVFLPALFFGLNAEPAPAVSGERDVSDITKKVYPSVVRVEVINAMRKVATGVVVDKEGHIVTTALVSPRDGKIIITTSEGRKVDAEFLGMDTLTHLALIKAKDKKLAPIEMGDAKELVSGAWIAVVGIAVENTPSVTQGIVSSLSEDAIRLNVWVVRGASGSPVVDSKGRMVGLLRGVYSDESPVVFEFRERDVVGSGYVFSRAEAPSSGMALAIPVQIVKKVSTEIKKKGKMERGWLGISIAENEDGKIEIVTVEKESPAELASLKEGDIILQFDGKDVSSTEKLAKDIRSKNPGYNVTLKIERKEEVKDIKVKLGEFPQSEIIRELESRFPHLFPSKPGQPLLRIPESVRPKAFAWSVGKRKSIGVYLQQLNEELSEYFGVKEGNGLLVSKVSEDSPAEKAGLKVGDVIIKADDKRVETVNQLSKSIQDKKDGEKIKIEFIRDKKTMSAEVEIKVEESGEDFFSLRGWEGYVESWGDYVDIAKEQLNKWQDQYSKDNKERMLRMKKEIEQISEKVSKEISQKSKSAEKLMKEALKKYRGIKV